MNGSPARDAVEESADDRNECRRIGATIAHEGGERVVGVEWQVAPGCTEVVDTETFGDERSIDRSVVRGSRDDHRRAVTVERRAQERGNGGDQLVVALVKTDHVIVR